MMDDALRRVKDAVYAPVAARLGATVSPLAITLTGGIVGVAAALAGSQGAYTLGLTLWLANRVLDGLDGAVARAAGRGSALGGYLDQMTDFVVYALIPLGLALSVPGAETLLALAFMLSTFYVNAGGFLYLAAILEQRNAGARQRGDLTTIHMPKGLIEGAETILFYTLFFLFPQALGVLFVVFGVLVIITTLGRLAWAVRHLG